MSRQIEAGSVYLVPDHSVKLPPEEDRETHPQRTVMVVSHDKINQSGDWAVIMVAPISGSTRFRTQYCVKLSAGEGNVTKKCWVRTSAVQPIAKSELGDYMGKVSEERLQDVMQELLSILPLAVEDDDIMQWSDQQEEATGIPLAPVAPLPSAVFAGSA